MGDLNTTYAYNCIPFRMYHMHTNFQRSILINKKVEPHVIVVSWPWEGLTDTNAHYCILFCMSSMHTKFQLSILINKKLLKRGGLRPPTKGRFAVHRRVNLHVHISYCSIYAYQISDIHFNDKKRGAFGPMPGPYLGSGGEGSIRRAKDPMRTSLRWENAKKVWRGAEMGNN